MFCRGPSGCDSHGSARTGHTLPSSHCFLSDTGVVSNSGMPQFPFSYPALSPSAEELGRRMALMLLFCQRKSPSEGYFKDRE